jgi:hypothetical protein
MKPEQALNIIKQTLDLTLKAGVIPNIESAEILLSAFTYIKNQILEPQKINNV